jgi:hypothetical protein
MSDELKEIRQGKRVYRFAKTEELVIGGYIWTRDRYQNCNGDATSYLLINFTNTGVSAYKRAEPAYVPQPKPAPNPKRTATDFKKYIQDWKDKGLVK